MGKHHRISSLKALQDAEARRLTLAIGLTERAMREWEEEASCQQGRELHLSIDEKRFKNRSELLALHDTLQTLESENRALRGRLGFGGVASFGASLMQLMRVARGGGSAGDP